MIVARRTIAAALLAGALPLLARAAAIPRGPVVLSVKGRVARPNAGDRCDFDMTMLAALPQASFSTATPWYDGPRRFTGPLLRDVLAAAGAEGSQLRAVALNDYRIDIPADDARRYDVIAARLLNGQPMTVRERGPLFIVYPFDSRPELRSTEFYSRCCWQLRTLEVS